MTLDVRNFAPGRPVRVLLSTGGTYEGKIMTDSSPDVLYLDQTGQPNLHPEASRIVCIVATHIVSVRFNDRTPPKERKQKEERKRRGTYGDGIERNPYEGDERKPDHNSVRINDNVSGGIPANLIQEFGWLMLTGCRIRGIDIMRAGHPIYAISERDPVAMLRSALKRLDEIPTVDLRRVGIDYYEAKK